MGGHHSLLFELGVHLVDRLIPEIVDLRLSQQRPCRTELSGVGRIVTIPNVMILFTRRWLECLTSHAEKDSVAETVYVARMISVGFGGAL